MKLAMNRSSRRLGVASFVGGSALLALTALPTEAAAKGKVKVGLGGGLGDPLGPSLKLFLHPQHALQFDLGWAPLHHGDGITHANYLFHLKPFVSKPIFDFGMYFGGGLGVIFWAPSRVRGCRDFDDELPGRCRRGYYARHYDHGTGGAAFMVRAPVGVYFHWGKIPIDTVMEAGWSPYIVHWDPFHADFSVKIRYYFGGL